MPAAACYSGRRFALNADPSPMIRTLLWHDYEAFGADPRRDRPAQFAAIRTDEQLNEVGEPLMWYCVPPLDYLPSPTACLITGITPQLAARKGLSELAFIRNIHQAFSQPGTCGVGYNTLRYDDEMTRHTLYRNLLDPYGREWQNGNSRWDIIDMVRTCYALRPEGLHWPQREDGAPSFRLDQLVPANGIDHGQAHDALADVRATIALARKIREAQPKLYDYLYNLRSKQQAAAQLKLPELTPLVHVSSRFAAQQGCINWVLPLAFHPSNRNAVICAVLDRLPDSLKGFSVEELRQRLYSRKDELDGDRPPLKLVHLNRCPVLAPAKMLSRERAAELGIDAQLAEEALRQWRADAGLRDLACSVFAEGEHGPADDVELDLYGGFISDGDRATMALVHSMSPQDLASASPHFNDPRLNELLFRLRARNWPDSLNPAEQRRWLDHCQRRLASPNPVARDFQSFATELEELAERHASDEAKMAILKACYDWAARLAG